MFTVTHDTLVFVTSAHILCYDKWTVVLLGPYERVRCVCQSVVSLPPHPRNKYCTEFKSLSHHQNAKELNPAAKDQLTV